MKFSRLLKGITIVLSLIVITACSSTNQPSYTVTTSPEDVKQIKELQTIKTVYFDFDKYNIKPSFAKTLDAHAAFLLANPSFHITIEGHADERGTPEYNIALGERRALAVKLYLQGRGISAEQMSIISYGKLKPAVLGHDEKAYEKNRRAVIEY